MTDHIHLSQAPVVSILMTSYNRERYISEAIRSVLASSYQDWELIICDDCSTDNTVLIAKKFAASDSRIRVYVNEQNLGQFPNRNKAATYALGKYIKYLDSDDLIYPDGLKTMVELMEAHPTAGLGYCCPAHMLLHPIPHLYTSKEIYEEHYFLNGVLLRGPTVTIMKTEAYKATGGFDFFGMPSDSHFSLKVAALYPVLSMPSGLTLWREHDNQEFNSEKSAENIFYNFKWNLDILQSRFCPLSSKRRRKAIANQRKVFLRNLLVQVYTYPGFLCKLLTLYREHRIGWSLIFPFKIKSSNIN